MAARNLCRHVLLDFASVDGTWRARPATAMAATRLGTAGADEQADVLRASSLEPVLLEPRWRYVQIYIYVYTCVYVYIYIYIYINTKTIELRNTLTPK